MTNIRSDRDSNIVPAGYNSRQYEYTRIKKRPTFHPLKVEGHGSETQLQVGENLNNIP